MISFTGYRHVDTHHEILWFHVSVIMTVLGFKVLIGCLHDLFTSFLMTSIIKGCIRQESRVVVPVFPRKEWDRYHGTLGDQRITFPDSKIK